MMKNKRRQSNKSSVTSSSVKMPIKVKTQSGTQSTIRKLRFLPNLKSLSSYCSTQQPNFSGVPLMVDDYQHRKLAHSETFIIGKNKVIKFEVAFTRKFCYFTIFDAKHDLSYKLRLIIDTGKSILERFKNYGLSFQEHLHQNQLKKYYLSAPFPPFQRKFEFTKIQVSQTTIENCEEDDMYLKNAIRQLDRTQFIYQPIQRTKTTLKRREVFHLDI